VKPEGVLQCADHAPCGGGRPGIELIEVHRSVVYLEGQRTEVLPGQALEAQHEHRRKTGKAQSEPTAYWPGRFGIQRGYPGCGMESLWTERRKPPAANRGALVSWDQVKTAARRPPPDVVFQSGEAVPNGPVYDRLAAVLTLSLYLTPVFGAISLNTRQLRPCLQKLHTSTLSMAGHSYSYLHSANGLLRLTMMVLA
jgi:hypothetical protein